MGTPFLASHESRPARSNWTLAVSGQMINGLPRSSGFTQHSASESGSSAVHRLILAGIVAAFGSGWLHYMALWLIGLECFLICVFQAAWDANVKEEAQGRVPKIGRDKHTHGRQT